MFLQERTMKIFPLMVKEYINNNIDTHPIVPIKETSIPSKKRHNSEFYNMSKSFKGNNSK